MIIPAQICFHIWFEIMLFFTINDLLATPSITDFGRPRCPFFLNVFENSNVGGFIRKNTISKEN
ncbi:MAG: hypothetical protein D6732_28430 [Methanobacteriota archaeon]|nr:MAG: hypothetical protein D6732_28430 [Euryarchaeota archaeon]